MCLYFLIGADKNSYETSYNSKVLVNADKVMYALIIWTICQQRIKMAGIPGNMQW
jgi:hypothetical protein